MVKVTPDLRILYLKYITRILVKYFTVKHEGKCEGIHNGQRNRKIEHKYGEVKNVNGNE